MPSSPWWATWGSKASNRCSMTGAVCARIGSVLRGMECDFCLGLSSFHGVLLGLQDFVWDKLVAARWSDLDCLNLRNLTDLLVCQMIYLIKKLTHVDWLGFGIPQPAALRLLPDVVPLSIKDLILLPRWPSALLLVPWHIPVVPFRLQKWFDLWLCRLLGLELFALFVLACRSPVFAGEKLIGTNEQGVAALFILL